MFTNLGSAAISRLFSVALALFLPGMAISATWDGEAGNGLWSDPLNWSGDALPGPADEVVILDAGTVHVDVDVVIFSLKFGDIPERSSVADTLIIDAGKTLWLTGDLTDSRYNNFLSESISISGELVLGDGANFSGAFVTNNGVIRALDNGLSSDGFFMQRNLPGSFVNNGTVYAEGAQIRLSRNVTNNGLINLTSTDIFSTATLEWFSEDPATEFSFINTASGVINGSGYFRVDGTQPFVNDGTIDISPVNAGDGNLFVATTVENNGTIGSAASRILILCNGHFAPTGTILSSIEVRCHSWVGLGSSNNFSDPLNWNQAYVPASGTTNDIDLDGVTLNLDVNFVLNGSLKLTNTTLTVNAGRTLTLNGMLRLGLPTFPTPPMGKLINLGTVVIAHSCYVHSEFENRSMLTISGYCENRGLFSNSGTMVISNTGSFKNYETYDNSGSTVNDGEFTNYETFQTTNSFRNNGNLFNVVNPSPRSLPRIVIEGMFTNAGLFEQSQSFFNSFSVTTNNGTITNTGTIDNKDFNQFVNNLSIVNSGTFIDACRAGLENNGSITGNPIEGCARWDGEAGDGLWGNPLNWLSNTLPGPANEVLLEDVGIIHVDIDVTIFSLKFGDIPERSSVADTLIIDAGKTLRLTGDLTDSRYNNFLHESISISGELVLGDGANFSGAFVTNNGVIRLLDNGLSSDGFFMQDNLPGSFENNGTIYAEGVRIALSRRFTNNGLINLTSGADIRSWASITWTGSDPATEFSFVNTTAGIINGSGSFSVQGTQPFVNDGTIDMSPVNAGDTTIRANTTIENNGSIGGADGKLENNATVINACEGVISIPVIGNPVEQLLCADLSLSKDAPATVGPGQQMTYTISIFNSGPETATNIYVTDQLPANVSLVDSLVRTAYCIDLPDGNVSCGGSVDPGVCLDNGGTVSCPVNDLIVSASGTINLTVQVAPTARGTLVNSAVAQSNPIDPDLANNEDTASTLIVDVEPPELTVPDDLSLEATSGAGAIAVFIVTATDDFDGEVSPTCVPGSGSQFALGLTIVECSATDLAGNSAKSQFNVTVIDTTPPLLSVPIDQVIEATSADGAVANYPSASALDIVDGSISPVCLPAAGSIFPLGTTTVTCTAVDAAGNGSAVAFNVMVRDTTAPDLTAPRDIVVEATSASGQTVDLGLPIVSDTVDSNPLIENNTPALFMLGTRIVIWTATDFSGNSSSVNQLVQVVDTTPPELIIPADIEVIATGPTTSIDIGMATASDIFGISSLTNDAPATFPIGVTEVTWTAIDNNGNETTEVQLVSSFYQFEGFVRPIVDGGTYKANQVLPIRVSVVFRDGSFVGGLTPTIVVNLLVAGVPSGDPVDVDAVGPASGGNVFEESSEFYVYNLSTRGFEPGQYRIGVDFGDGSIAYFIDVNLK